MKKMKKTLCLLLSLVLITQLGFVSQAAKSDTVKVTTVKEEHVNPLYEDLTEITETNESEKASRAIAVESQEPVTALVGMSEYISDEQEIAEIIREGMVNRESQIVFYYTNEYGYDKTKLSEWFQIALEETDQADEGDYLRWTYEGWNSSISYYSMDGKYYMDYTMNISYYTTKSQEDEVTAEVDRVLTELDVENANHSTYEKVKLIYDYLCENITYDYDNLYDDSYKLKYTAYAALINKTSVCQGYAVLLYRMLEEVDIDTRVIYGTGNGGAHSWNITKIGNLYYLNDATWDAGNSAYGYFLKGSDYFDDHYAESEFLDSYAVSKENYDPESGDSSEEDKDATEITNSVTGKTETVVDLYEGEEKIALFELERSNYIGSENEQPKVDEHLFAGWFSDEACTVPFTGTEGKAYAKFVDEDVLKVMAQASVGIRNMEKGKLRFLSTVDSANYANVGFHIEFNGKTLTQELKNVYKKFYAVKSDGSKKYYEPTIASPISKYFIAYTLTGVPQAAHDVPFNVTPYWTTLDGTYVEGVETPKVISSMNGY